MADVSKQLKELNERWQSSGRPYVVENEKGWTFHCPSCRMSAEVLQGGIVSAMNNAVVHRFKCKD